jgi:hypothetical protein
MKVVKWIEQEIEVEIGLDDIREALSEVLSATNQAIEEATDMRDILKSFNCVGQFLNAFDQHQIDRLNFGQRSMIEKYLRTAADRFKLPETA